MFHVWLERNPLVKLKEGTVSVWGAGFKAEELITVRCCGNETLMTPPGRHLHSFSAAAVCPKVNFSSFELSPSLLTRLHYTQILTFTFLTKITALALNSLWGCLKYFSWHKLQWCNQSSLKKDATTRLSFVNTTLLSAQTENDLLEVWNKTGHQGNKWNRAEVPLRKLRNFEVIFEGIRSSDVSGGAALDDLEFTDCAASRWQQQL